MANQFALFLTKRFSPMFFTQFLGAFNDNLFKQALLLMLTYEGAKQMGFNISLLNNLASLLFILPFFLFSSTAGLIADKYEKSQLIRYIKLLELTIAVIASIGFVFKLYVLLFVALFLLGLQSAFFGPIKYAYLPQALKKDELVAGNGLFQTGTSLAILTAMIVAGMLVKTGANNTWWLSMAVTLTAGLGYLSAREVPKTPASHSNLKLNWNIAKTSLQTVGFMLPYRALFFCLIGISWYWFYGATVLTQIAEITKTLLFANEMVVIFILTLFSVGIAFGSLFCKSLTKGRVTLKLMPIAVVGLSVFTVDLCIALSAFTDMQPVAVNNFYGVSELLGQWQAVRIFFDFLFIGVFGGFYIVPLYAFMQAFAPVKQRAQVIAANNILNALFMVTAALFAMFVLTVLKQTLPLLLLIIGLLNLLVGIYVWHVMKKNEHDLARQDEDSICL